MGYFVFFIWKWVTETIDPVIGGAMSTLIALVDRVRMLDNDMIRLNMKLSMLLEHYERTGKPINGDLEEILSKYASTSKEFDQRDSATKSAIDNANK